MRCNWLIESDVFLEDLHLLADEVRRQGMRVGIASHVPLHSGATYLDLFDPGDCVFFYGSIEFGEQVQREASWTPGVYFDRRNYDFTAYVQHLGHLMLAQEYMVVPYGDLGQKRRFMMEFYGQEDTIFIRPNGPDKRFTGQLVHDESFDLMIDRLGFYDLGPGELCVVSPPRNIIGEWRFVVADRLAIAGSRYRRDGKHCVEQACPDEAWELAQRAAAREWQPDRIWTIDICQTKVDFYVLEIGSVSTSGFYACDRQPIVREVSRIALEDWQHARVEK